MPFDVASVRGLFPSLGDGWIHLDSQNGTQIPDAVGSAVARGIRSFPVPGGGLSRQSVEAAAMTAQARSAIADLLDADPDCVVFGPSRAAVVCALVDALPVTRWIGDGIVLSRLDDEENIVPWLRGAARHGSAVRWAEVDVEQGTLPPWQYSHLVTDRTTVVAVTLASSTTGAITDIGQIAGHAHAAGALLVVDATNAAPFVPLTMSELGADVVVVSAERWGGPRMAAMVFSNRSMMDSLTNVSLNPHAVGPARLEVAAAPAALLSGVVASVDLLAGLESNASGTRRRRLTMSMDSTYEYLQRLAFYLVSSLDSLGHVNVIGVDTHRVPLVSFVVKGVAASKVCGRLNDNGISASFDLPSRALDAIGVSEAGGAVSVGLGMYSTPYEVDQLVRVLGSFG
ncbi:aminotransferase class V-fold PLP-dependent enzyme [Gordonia sp. PDNC005]|uniref:aminotransferase class V-fold PLP-dependent enzyme n=1 Tax=unclassified Gordonia (in: high G+C Gram-positive bacteria) TaxID=2657482 RepID=UPI0019632D78|nr:aminotransferase class V-fold PLP-dependent enzyme [Gordonia sp. PDNC005]QRY62514.1 aminotransferase class V-fold PLP-dependent enzyme [Gordonia sp. PDNC005]